MFLPQVRKFEGGCIVRCPADQAEPGQPAPHWRLTGMKFARYAQSSAVCWALPRVDLSRVLSRHVTTLSAKYLQTSQQLRHTMRSDVTLFVTIKSVNILCCQAVN